jgi:hypothetical protein
MASLKYSSAATVGAVVKLKNGCEFRTVETFNDMMFYVVCTKSTTKKKYVVDEEYLFSVFALSMMKVKSIEVPQ